MSPQPEHAIGADSAGYHQQAYKFHSHREKDQLELLKAELGID